MKQLNMQKMSLIDIVSSIEYMPVTLNVPSTSIYLTKIDDILIDYMVNNKINSLRGISYHDAPTNDCGFFNIFLLLKNRLDEYRIGHFFVCNSIVGENTLIKLSNEQIINGIFASNPACEFAYVSETGEQKRVYTLSLNIFEKLYTNQTVAIKNDVFYLEQFLHLIK